MVNNNHMTRPYSLTTQKNAPGQPWKVVQIQGQYPAMNRKKVRGKFRGRKAFSKVGFLQPNPRPRVAPAGPFGKAVARSRTIFGRFRPEGSGETFHRRGNPVIHRKTPMNYLSNPKSFKKIATSKVVNSTLQGSVIYPLALRLLTFGGGTLVLCTVYTVYPMAAEYYYNATGQPATWVERRFRDLSQNGTALRKFLTEMPTPPPTAPPWASPAPSISLAASTSPGAPVLDPAGPPVLRQLEALVEELRRQALEQRSRDQELRYLLGQSRNPSGGGYLWSWVS